MPRRKSLRKVLEPPKFSGYKPYGYCRKGSGYVELLYEEYEAIKLTDYYLKNHHEACKMMGISRATFARVYESARRKIAHALVDTKEIKVRTGNAYLEEQWYFCHGCYARFPNIYPKNTTNCPECNSGNLEQINV